MLRRLILWDIDGTLLTVGSAGRLALEHAAAAVASIPFEQLPAVRMGGKTDPQIVREILTAAGLDQHEIDEVMPEALAEAERYLASEVPTMEAEGRVHPGVRELLESLSKTEGVRQSLLTGNLLPNAVVKVSLFGLDPFLDVEVGAYGTDDADRNLLVPVAMRRVRDLRGEEYRPEEVWVIGDTRHDLACARAGGVRALLVGTGREGVDAEEAGEADAFFEDLSDTAGALARLLG